jgi:hypothetical protein
MNDSFVRNCHYPIPGVQKTKLPNLRLVKPSPGVKQRAAARTGTMITIQTLTR